MRRTTLAAAAALALLAVSCVHTTIWQTPRVLEPGAQSIAVASSGRFHTNVKTCDIEAAACYRRGLGDRLDGGFQVTTLTAVPFGVTDIAVTAGARYQVQKGTLMAAVGTDLTWGLLTWYRSRGLDWGGKLRLQPQAVFGTDYFWSGLRWPFGVTSGPPYVQVFAPNLFLGAATPGRLRALADLSVFLTGRPTGWGLRVWSYNVGVGLIYDIGPR